MNEYIQNLLPSASSLARIFFVSLSLASSLTPGMCSGIVSNPPAA